MNTSIFELRSEPGYGGLKVLSVNFIEIYDVSNAEQRPSEQWRKVDRPKDTTPDEGLFGNKMLKKQGFGTSRFWKFAKFPVFLKKRHFQKQIIP